ncbi:unnamed protein product [Miscanthus lutarioriparius]|uniref:Retrovirus-related Pol polyprotein from transposon TNT 1-94-like beta-barrel domain-containing protein n=1 Tax=Miscanthus lutarioriparius TaxID=422564 RepID=A0A811QIP8_9POAL|nr:unnamed protein product [Miscanthus lutarioriparius]
MAVYFLVLGTSITCCQDSPRPARETGQHVGDVFMMQGSGNGGSGSNSRDNQWSDHDAVDVKSFIVDSGASVHATGDPNLFSYLEDTTTNMRLCTANGSTMDITGRGTVRHHNITLHGVLLVPRLAVNIVSVSKLGELDYTVEFTRTNCFIRDAAQGTLSGKDTSSMACSSLIFCRPHALDCASSDRRFKS